MAIINAFPDGVAQPDVRELCRFTRSGTFDPAQYPTADGLYDVYIVGGGGGGYKYRSHPSGNPISGGGGGYAKLLKRLALSGTVAVTIGAAGQNGTNNTLTGSGSNAVTAKDGGATKFGGYGTANGGKCTNSYVTGGDGGCGGAGLGGSMGGVDGGDGTAGQNVSNSDGGNAGKGGGNKDYCPTNPYDGQHYGIGGNTFFVTTFSGNVQTKIGFPILNSNPGRAGSGWSENYETGNSYPPLPGVCIIYGKPLE